MPQFDWSTFSLKLKLTLTSRKFWSLVSSLVATASAYYSGAVPGPLLT